MIEKKKAPAGAGNTAKGKTTTVKSKGSQKSSNNNISEKTKSSQTEKKKVKLTLESSMKTMAVKIYEEQLGEGGITEFTKKIKEIDENKVQVIAIIHNRDFQGDDFFLPSTDKQHIHLIERSSDGVPRKIRTLLNMFGIKLRPEEDANLWEHAIQKVGQFSKYAAYLTHETKEAVEDGKAKYEMEELISNLSKEEIRTIQQAHIYTGKQQPKTATIDEQANWCDMARAAGYNMEPYEDFEEKIPLVVKKQIEKYINRAYYRGQNDRVEEVRKSDFTRCAIFIKGKENQGKTFAAIHAFDDLGYKTICIDEATQTGKFDKLTAHHKVMIVDDAIIRNVLGLSDDKPCECYRRNKENPYFIGEYFIATSNLNFEDWCRMCGINEEAQLKAARSRFFICEVDDIDGEKYLRVDECAKRGQAKKLQKKIDMMYEFKIRFEGYIKEYNPDEIKVDSSKLWANDPVPKPVEMKKQIKGQKHINDYQQEDGDWLPFG